MRRLMAQLDAASQIAFWQSDWQLSPHSDRMGLRLNGPALRRFDDPVYLHQVVQRGPDGLRRFTDLPEAFASLGEDRSALEWRVHFHVPIFLERLAPFASTQAFIREVLALQRQEPVSTHLEVETYTWGVLPESFRSGPVEAAIARELGWVRAELAIR